MKDFVAASQAASPFDGYDSTLALPDPKGSGSENAVLTLILRVRLNFVDSTNPNKRLIRTSSGSWYARDTDGWSFPILDWTPTLRRSWEQVYKKVAEDFWSDKFLLFTPSDFSDFDYVSGNGGSAWRVRPNVRCRFRLDPPFHSAHRVINVYRIASNPSPPGQPYMATGGPGSVKAVDAPEIEFRADDSNYKYAALFAITTDPVNHITHTTVTHEIGHAIGQSHIEAYTYKFWLHQQCNIEAGDSQNENVCYGDQLPIAGTSGSPSAWNVMGGGDRLDTVNAISWKKRIAEHTGRVAEDWLVQMNSSLPPRKVPLARYGPPNLPYVKTVAYF